MKVPLERAVKAPVARIQAAIHGAARALAVTAIVITAGPAMSHEEPEATQPTVVPLVTRDLPEFPGKQATLATVEYLPGGASRPHRHGAHVFVYVLEGSYATQVAGGERKVLKPGETFYENPSDEHVVSENASATEPVKILVFMLKDKAPSS